MESTEYSDAPPSGPLHGVRIVELAGLGPLTLAGKIMSDWGADILRVTRPRAAGEAEVYPPDFTSQGRTEATLDLKHPADVELVARLSEQADVFVEGLRPGVTERLGLGPDALHERNARLVYGRMTGWGQEGPRAAEVGHDINYLSVTGALGAIGRADEPVPPLNLVGDYGGGAMFLVAGVLAALLERVSSGRGQVVDAAMVDGISVLMSTAWAKFGAGSLVDRRESNLLDGGAPFYDTYACSDGGFVAVGCIEPAFWRDFTQTLGLVPLAAQMDRSRWPELKRQVAEALKQRTRDEWVATFAGTNACVTPVLNLSEACHDAHLVARQVLRTGPDGVPRPSPAPRFSRSSVNREADLDSKRSLPDLLLRWGAGTP